MRFLIIVIALVIVISTLQAEESEEDSDTLMAASTPTLTASPTLALTMTPTASATNLAELTPFLELTEEILPTQTSTPPLEITEEAPVAEQTSELDPSPALPETTQTEPAEEMLTPTPTAAPSLTLTLTPSPTFTLTPVLDFRQMPTATPGIPMLFFTGTAFYQNRLPDHSGIRVYVLAGDGVLLSIAQTEARGFYSIAVPANSFYRLIIEAPLHKAFETGIWPGETPPPVTLPGGDLNSDGCIGQTDLALITHYLNDPETLFADINGDSLVDIIDVAILTGNYQPACEALLLLTPVPTINPAPPTLTAEPETTAEANLPELEITPQISP